MIDRYITNFHRTRATTVALSRAARAGDKEAMLRLRAMALCAGVFSGLSVNNAVWRQEETFSRWQKGEAIRGLPAHQCVDRVGAWVAGHMTLDMFDDESGVAFAESACENILYLGTAKSHFFAACMGFDRVPCVDTWMSKVLKERGVMKQKVVPQSFKQYRRLVEASEWKTLDQWRLFLDVPPQFAGKACFGETHHDVLYRALLGDRAVVA